MPIETPITSSEEPGPGDETEKEPSEPEGEAGSLATGDALDDLMAEPPAEGDGEAPPAATTDAAAAPSGRPEAGEELVARRTERSRTVRDDSGTLTTTLFDRPVHFRDAMGDWKRISTRVVEDRATAGFALRNEAGPFEVRFAPRAAGPMVRYRTADGRWLSVGLRGAGPVPAEAAGDTVAYRQALPGVDVVYEVLPSGVKESLLLAGPTSPSSFVFDVHAPELDLSAAEQPDGSWAVFSAPSTDPLFVIPAPFAVDAPADNSRAPVTDPHATMSVVETTDGLTITVAVDPVWLASPERAFPVEVDPTVEVTLGATDDAYFDNACPTCRGYRNGDLPVGTDTSHVYRSMTRFDLAGLPAAIDVKAASLWAGYDGSCIAVGTGGIGVNSTTTQSSSAQPVVCGTEDHTIGVHGVFSDWSATSTRSSQVSASGSPISSVTIKAIQEPGWVSWPITGTVRDWVEGRVTNRGLQLRRSNESALKAGPIFSSYRAGGGFELDISYDETVELLPPRLVRSDGARLDWTRFEGLTGDTFAAYEVHRGSFSGFAPGSQTLLTTITDQDVTTFTDTTAKASTSFTYKVVVRKGNGTSATSKPLTLSTETTGRARAVFEPLAAGDGDVTQITDHDSGTTCVDYGVNPRMQVGQANGSLSRGLLRFDLRDVPTEAQILASTLHLYHETVTDPATVEAVPVESDWEEGTGDGTTCTGHGASWTDRTDGGVRWATEGGDTEPVAVATVVAPAGQAAGWHQFPLAGVTQRGLSGQQPDHGLLLRSATESIPGAVRYVTDDDTATPDLRPWLEVTYVDGNQPTVPTIELPEMGAVLSGTVALTPKVWDDRKVESVTYKVNNTSTTVGTPFTFNWNTAAVENSTTRCTCSVALNTSRTAAPENGPGAYRITATAVDDAGNQSESVEYWAYVANAAPPTGAIQFPLAGTIVTGTTAVSASAGADGDVGAKVASVELLVDGTAVAVATASPYTFSWDTLSNITRTYDGPAELSLRVTDDQGNVTSTVPRTVHVDNGGVSRFRATFTSSEPPTHVAAGVVPETTVLTATVTNTSGQAWNGDDMVLRAHWRHSDAWFEYDVGGEAELGDTATTGEQIAAGASRNVTISIAPPPPRPGVDRDDYRLELDVLDRCMTTSLDHGLQCQSGLFSSRGNKPKSSPVVVDHDLDSALGLEQYWHYIGGELGGGAQQLVNVANGNVSTRLTPLAAPGRGLNTVVDITYNSREAGGDSQLGPGWSLAVSGLVRAGERLHIKPATQNGAKPKVTLVDADGTSHVFTGTADTTGAVYYEAPPGVQLYLRQQPTSSTERWLLTRPDRVTFAFDANGWPTKVTDANGNQLTFTSADPPKGDDDPGRGQGRRQIKTITDAGGRQFKLDYFTKAETSSPRVRGQIQYLTDHDGSRLEFGYYNDGNLRRITQHGEAPNAPSDLRRVPTADRHWRFTYTTSNLAGPAIAARADRTDPAESTPNQSTHLYSVIDPLDNETTFSYVTSGQHKGKVASTTDRADAVTTFAYDLSTRTTTVAAPESRTTAYTYDTAGKVTSITNPRGDTIGVEWTDDFQVGRIDEPGGASTSYTYDHNGALTSSTDGEGNTTVLRYAHPPADALDDLAHWAGVRDHGHISELIEKVDPNGVATTTVADDHTWTFERDPKGNLTALVDPEGYRTEYAVNANGTVASVTDPTNATTTYPTYHASGQPTKVVDAENRQTLLHYDTDGLLVGVTDPAHIGLSGAVAEYQTRYRYDALHRLVRTSTPKSTTTERGVLLWSETTYDANDNVTRTTQPAYGGVDVPARGPATDATFDVMDRPTKVESPDVDRDQGDNSTAAHTREVTEIAYDTAGRTVKVTAPKGTATATDPDDYTTTLVYDALDRVIRSVEANIDNEPGQQRVVGEAARTHYCYDDAGDMIWEVGSNARLETVDCAASKPSHTTVYAYDLAHRPTAVTDAEGRTTSRDFDANGNVTSVTDPAGVTTTVRYDERNLPVESIDPLTVDANNASTRDLVTRRVFDGAGRLREVISPRAYDASSDKQTFDDYVTRYVHDRTGLVTRVDLPTDATTGQYHVHRSYDAAGRLALVSLPTEHADLATARAAAPDRFTEVDYYDMGWVRRQDVNLDGAGDPQPAMLFDYHPAGLQASRVVVDDAGAPDESTRMRWTYNDGLTLRERVDEGGQRSFYDYDRHGQLVNAVDADGVAEADAEVRQTVLDHDGLGRVVISYERNEPPGTTDAASDWQVTTSAYNPDGTVSVREEDIRQPGKDAVVGSGRKRVFTYDETGRPATQRDHGKDPGSDADDHLVEFDFDAVGREVSRVVQRHTGSQFTMQQTTTWDWLANGKLDVLTTSTPSGVTERHEVGYLDLGGVYVNGHRTVDEFVLATPGGAAPCPPSGSGCQATYRYDALERLTFATDGHGGSSSYTLDAAGNATEIVRDPSGAAGDETVTTQTYAGQQTLTLTTTEGAAEPVTLDYFYDRRGELDCVTVAPGSAADCATAVSNHPTGPSPNLVASYGWDYLDRIETVKSYQAMVGAPARIDTVADYRHDALDRLSEQLTTRHDTTTSTGTVTGEDRVEYDYLSTSPLVLDERHFDGTATSPSKTRAYLFDGLGQRLGMSQTEGTTTDSYTYAHDVHGSVSQLISASGATAGDVTATYGYDPHGKADPALTAGDDGDDPINVWRYTGKRLDPATGNLDMGARHFSPDTTRFLQDDALSGAMANLSLSTDPLTGDRYGLAGGNPISFIEVDGHFPTVDGRGMARVHADAGNDYDGAGRLPGDTRRRPNSINSRGGGADPFTYLSQADYDRVLSAGQQRGTGSLDELLGVLLQVSGGQDAIDCVGDRNAASCGLLLAQAFPLFKAGRVARTLSKLRHTDDAALGAVRGFGRSLDDLSAAARAAGKGDLTVAGHALTKHAAHQRAGSGAFPALRGGPRQINELAQLQVDDILTHPGSQFTQRTTRRYGDVLDVFAPDGRGIRFGSDGRFIGFLEPRR